MATRIEDAQRENAADSAAGSTGEATHDAGATTRVGLLQRKMQRRALQRSAGEAATTDGDAAHRVAAEGLAGSAGPLPHGEAIQRSFGDHDVSGVAAHVGGPASGAAEKLGATAYAVDGAVAFREAPDLHTAAHEAAHVVQQRAGVHLKGGVGQEGDVYERHADAVADAVVAGRPAAPLLDEMAPRGSAARGSSPPQLKRALQLDKTKDATKDATKDSGEAHGAGGGTHDEKPRALEPNERILTKDPTYADAKFVGWFCGQVKAKLDAWGLAFDDKSVRFAEVLVDGKPVKAILLAWDAAMWGDAPTTHELPLTLAPLDARAAVAAVHKLAGWKKVPSGDQAIVDNVLGGEENQLSSAARDHLRPLYKALGSESPDNQAKAIQGTLDTKSTVTGWSAESFTAAVAKVTLAGPTAQKDYDFRGTKADAESWNAAFSDGPHFPIIAPKATTPGYHNHTVAETADAATFLPKATRSVIDKVVLNPNVNPDDAHWAVEYSRPDFHSYMTAGIAGVVDIYPDKTTNALPDADGMRNAMTHETGHTWSYKTWGEDETKGKWLDWKKAMADDKVSVSGYATAAIAEDVAETIRVYVATKSSPRFAEYDKMVPHRFAILKKEYDK